MPANFAFYYSDIEHLPPDLMTGLSRSVQPEVGVTSRGLTYTYRMPEGLAIISEMPAAMVASHLAGFEGYVVRICRNNVPDQGKAIISRIRQTRLVVGLEFQPDVFDETWHMFEQLVAGHDPLVFANDTICNTDFQVLLAPDGSHELSL